jgi:hypothetical protein
MRLEARGSEAKLSVHLDKRSDDDHGSILNPSDLLIFLFHYPRIGRRVRESRSVS